MKQQAPDVHRQLLAKAKEYGFDASCTGDVDIMDVHLTGNETRTEDAEVVTTGCFGNEGNSTHDGSETDCSDGLDWVWDRKILETALGKKMAF
jgi:hypothetical protein